jgi:hypothetical protein
MYEVETQDMSPEFLECWKAAGIHISNQVQGGLQSWLKATPFPPFLEHLSFRLGNQNFYIRVTDVSGELEGPGSEIGLFAIADGSQGHACIMPMRKKLFGGWVTDRPGWGLIDARTGRTVNPIELVSDERIEMSDWELQDFAVQVVRTQIEKEGFKLMSWQGNPNVDPALWFIGESKRPEWVVVRAVRYPVKEAVRPPNWEDIAEGCAPTGEIGHFASVAVASADDPFDPMGVSAVPLYRGHAMHVSYAGLQNKCSS